MTRDKSQSSQQPATTTNNKVGELIVTLDGLRIDMNNIPTASPPILSVYQQSNGHAQENGSSLLPPLARNANGPNKTTHTNGSLEGNIYLLN